MCTDLRSVIEKSRLLLLELSHIRQQGPHLRIIHRFGKIGVDCCVGEEVVAVYIIDGTNEIMLPLSLALRLVLDYLARYRHIPQSATQIAAGMRATPFYCRHGLRGGSSLRRKISRTTVKEYVKRIRAALTIASRGTSSSLNPRKVLISLSTAGNEVVFKLRASVEWVHIDDLAD